MEGIMHLCFIYHQSSRNFFSTLTVILMCGGEVCGWDADDARLIRASVNTPPTEVVVSFPNSPVLWSFWSMGNFSSWGAGFCSSILNPAVLAPHKLSLPFSHVSSSCSHASSLANLGPVARLDCGKGQMRGHACPEHWNPSVIPFFVQAAPCCAWGDLRGW
jgi:hypothetical protein